MLSYPECGRVRRSNTGLVVLSGSLRQAAGGLQLLSVTVTGRFELELQGVSVRNGRVEAAGMAGGAGCRELTSWTWSTKQRDSCEESEARTSQSSIPETYFFWQDCVP